MLSILQKKIRDAKGGGMNVWMLEEGWMKVRRGRKLLKWDEWINTVD